MRYPHILLRRQRLSGSVENQIEQAGWRKPSFVRKVRDARDIRAMVAQVRRFHIPG